MAARDYAALDRRGQVNDLMHAVGRKKLLDDSRRKALVCAMYATYLAWVRRGTRPEVKPLPHQPTPELTRPAP